MRRPCPDRTAFRHWCREKLRNADTDQFRHVNNSVMASLFEAGRMELFNEASIASQPGKAHPAVVRLLLDFHRELFYPGEVSIGTRVERVGDRSVEIMQGLFDSQGCVASAEAVCVFLDPAAGRATAIHEEFGKQLVAKGGLHVGEV